MPEGGEKNVSRAEERRRTYGAEQDAETERQQEKVDEKSDTRGDLYGEPGEDRDKDADPRSPLDKGVAEEQEELRGRRPE